ncbi:MAG: hypothetical protein KC621_25335, partial [Myxococcales bacterium]|nr:hypothetical protein [Myxococcales bacterium]
GRPLPALGPLLARIDDAPCDRVDGLRLSPYPSASFRVLRYLSAERLAPEVRDRFARPSREEPELAAAFVDPAELDFRTFENILPLDRRFEGAPLTLTLTPARSLGDDVWTATLGGEGMDALRALDGLDLYAPPANPGSRGGRRLVFLSALLAQSVGEAVRASLPAEVLDGFSHVNPVFRLNRIDVGEAGFAEHLDSPYTDLSSGHLSRYTLLIYLTGGRSDGPVLRVGDLALDALEPSQVVVFHQRHPHASAPYADGSRIFLRTELVFACVAEELASSERVGAWFERACYLTGESLLSPELGQDAHELYDRVARAHWSGRDDEAGRADEAFLAKTWRGVPFVTNGFDWWFPRCPALSVVDCAAIALLDQLDARIGDRSFRGWCDREVLRRPADAAWVPAWLASQALPERDPWIDLPEELLGTANPPDPTECCADHAGGFEPTICPDVIALWQEARDRARDGLAGAPFHLLGQAVALRREWFRISGDRIDVLSPQAPLRPLNFASMDWRCWHDSRPEDFVTTDVVIDALLPVVPPILFAVGETCVHLALDFFRNRWMVGTTVTTVPIPRIKRHL